MVGYCRGSTFDESQTSSFDLSSLNIKGSIVRTINIRFTEYLLKKGEEARMSPAELSARLMTGVDSDHGQRIPHWRRMISCR